MEPITGLEKCNELKQRLQQHYANITDDDLQCNNGRKEEMLTKLKQKLGKTHEELHELILSL